MRRRSKPPRAKIGLEIEVNDFTNRLADNLDRSVWTYKSEHCGYELISNPATGHKEISKLAKSIKKLGKCKPGFSNAGTHIHIDFLSDSTASFDDLVRLEAKKLDGGSYDNPLGNGKRYFWITQEGHLWAKPSDYVLNTSPSRGDSAQVVFESTSHAQILRNVKRFLRLGIRFAPVLFAIQHPDRWVNKYSHTIEHWDEDLLDSKSSILQICREPMLLNNHRRTMFNPLSFAKFGTIEVRMIKASLDWRDVMMHINLFVRMANLAKSNEQLPERQDDLAKSLLILLDACEIHGKSRRTIVDVFNKNMEIGKFNCICYHYECQRYGDSSTYTDFGLSRVVCDTCCENTFHCIICGLKEFRSSDYYGSNFVDLSDGRTICNDCNRYNLPRLTVETDDAKYILGSIVHGGFDKNGNQCILRNARERFTKRKTGD